MALVAGEIGILLPKLHNLYKEEHNLARRVGLEIMSLIAKLENIQSELNRVSDEDQQRDQQINLWTKDARELYDRIDRLIINITSGLQSGSAAIPSFGIIARIKLNLKPKSQKATRKFVEDIKNANRLVEEFVDRHERYRIDPGVFPFPPPRSPASDVNELQLEDMGTEMATAKELDVLLVDKKKEHDYKLPRRVKEDIKFLIAEMQIVAVVLPKIAGLPAGELDEVTEAWADGLRDVSRNIKSAVDNFKRAVDYSTVSSRKARRQFAGEIRDSMHCLLEVAKRRKRYDLPELRVPKLNSGNNVSVGTRLQDQSFVAIDGHRDDVLEKLLTDQGTTSKQELKMVSIVGVAGVGKTTLANVVYSSHAVESFDCKAWVSLPTLPGSSMKGVLHDLLQQIEGHKGQHAASESLDVGLAVMEEKDIIKKICQSLQNKRYFIVIDNLWDLTAWSTMKQALIGNSNGSVVLTTSRRADIVEHKAGVYILYPLSRTDSRKLFYKTLFHNEEKCPPGLSEISEKFIEKCGGISATIISTAVLLESKPWAVKEWYEVLDSAYKLDQGPIDTRRILDKSYHELPVHLKSCLLYLSLFPKSYEISIEQLVWQWIAEGRLIQEIQGETLQEVGERYLKELMKGMFLKSIEVDAGGKALSCSVYDLVHDLIVSKASDEKFVTVVNGSNGISSTDRIHRLSIQGISSDQSPLKVSSSDLRTLMIYSDANANAGLMPSLSSFQQLHVLDLRGWDCLQNDHLKGIENLFLLKYLAIGGICITYLPKEIARLHFLQTLDLRGSGLKELPESVVLLRQLERLCVDSHMKIPEGIGEMKDLKELGDINISKPVLLEKLFKLAKLKILRIAIWTWDESYNVALLEYMRSSRVQGNDQNIQSLSVLTCCSLHFMDSLDVKWNLLPGLQRLEIRESSFLTLPEWIGSLQNLLSLNIEVYKLSQQMVDILGKLKNLCTLSLTSKRAPEGRFGVVPDGFKNLTSFKFSSSAVGQLFATEPKGMQMFKRLQLSFKALQTEDINQDFSFGMENLCSLEHVRVEIICFNANRQVVENAEAAIRRAISRSRSRCPNLEIRRVREGDMIDSEEKDSEEKVEVSIVKEEQQKETKNQKSSSWKIRVTSKKFWKKKRRVTRKYRILSLDIKSRIFTLQAI